MSVAIEGTLSAFRPTFGKNDAYYSWTAEEAVFVHASELLNHLAQFTGSVTLQRQALIRRVLLTEGVVFLANAAGAHWLTDAIASYLVNERVRVEPFQVWTLKANATSRRGGLTMTDGNSSTPIVGQTFDYTDFPLGEIALWLVADGGGNWVLMLPSEH